MVSWNKTITYTGMSLERQRQSPRASFFFKEFSECGPHLLGRVPVVYILFIVPFLVFIPQSIVLGFCWESKSVITSPLCVSQN